MSDRKPGKQQVLLRVSQEMHDDLIEQAARAQLSRKVKVTVQSLVVEQLEFVNLLMTEHPEIYDAAKAAVERTNKS